MQGKALTKAEALATLRQGKPRSADSAAYHRRRRALIALRKPTHNWKMSEEQRAYFRDLRNKRKQQNGKAEDR